MMRIGIFFLCVFLVGCGGGGGSTPEVVPYLEPDNPAPATGWQPISLPVDLGDGSLYWAWEENATRQVLLTDTQILLLANGLPDDRVIDIYRSDDKGLSWIKDEVVLIDPVRFDEVPRAAIELVTPDRLLYTTLAVGTAHSPGPTQLRSYVFDAHVSELVSSGDIGAVFERVRRRDGGVLLYRSTDNTGRGGSSSLMLSRDEGVSFANIGSTFPAWYLAQVPEQLGCAMRLESAAADGRVAVFCDGFFLSDNEGDSWRPLPEIVDANGDFVEVSSESELTLSQLQSDVVYMFDKQNQGLYRHDGSAVWQVRLLPDQIMSLHFSSTEADVIYAAAGEGGAYVSIDGGFSWESLPGDISGLNVLEVKAAGEELFLVATDGVYVWNEP